ncbi:tRNA modification GTPase TrmE [Alkaliphilus metalliredigens QYMF]|uniref:tRNA modification GTPase MnmE n=1 Tax=Alkaliphilus metalliredigens (strain QYMF) TaxID=293826 RepID=MNME_ALKMQ|nr:tRNA uridine-5-carboxymethylaminomethyl(34) synthesis GTPase MnmE [Alkaliphilus metalliredigens]A6TXE5.1 RecName: Full=tRNA modification GTPase MnmE [Alkaliphilus metalliredigens QYMF]ABR50863.1 tRNA modification GTPase TrmE [Alkaliphilus metalliredigens QYMF]
MFLDDTIAAIATAHGEAGIGIVRISGEKALHIIDQVFQSKQGKKLKDISPRRITYGHIIDTERNERIDEVLVSYMKGPHTYTTEDVVEINCHGGMIPVKRILELILRKGARAADAGEFTKRAFLNGRIDLAQAEAVMDLVSAKTDMGFDVALNQLEGSLSKRVKKVKDELLDMLAHIEVSIDFSDEDVDEVTLDLLLKQSMEIEKKIKVLLETADTGKILREGLNTVIVGKPNVGKSSLLNALLKESRAIVTEVPGTTRDAIEEHFNIRGIPLNLIDTAGIRETEDIVEKIGVERSKAFFNKADLIILMLDASRELTPEDLQIMELVKSKKALILVNKTDLTSQIDYDRIIEIVGEKKVIKISLIEESGLEEVEEALVEIVYKGETRAKDSLLVTNVRHKNALERALESLTDGVQAIKQKMPLDFVEVDVKNAWDALGEITGDTVGEDLLDHIFQNFCIGK